MKNDDDDDDDVVGKYVHVYVDLSLKGSLEFMHLYI